MSYFLNSIGQNFETSLHLAIDIPCCESYYTIYPASNGEKLNVKVFVRYFVVVGQYPVSILNMWGYALVK